MTVDLMRKGGALESQPAEPADEISESFRDTTAQLLQNHELESGSSDDGKPGDNSVTRKSRGKRKKRCMVPKVAGTVDSSDEECHSLLPPELDHFAQSFPSASSGENHIQDSCETPRNPNSHNSPPPDTEHFAQSFPSATDQFGKNLQDSNKMPVNNTRVEMESEAKKTLCPCIDCTADDVVFMTLMLGQKHSLSWDAQLDILQMIETIFDSNQIPVTKYKYMKYFPQEAENITHHIYCNKCNSCLGEKQSLEKTTLCENCQNTIDVSSASNYFLSLSITSQLEKFVQDQKFVSKILNFRFARPQKAEIYEDIYDGAIYKELSNEGNILSSPYNWSYTFFTDGVAFGNSSNRTLWPIYLTLNELPLEERGKYMVVAGLYVGPHDPNLQIFLKPFVEQANKIASEGFMWMHNGQQVVSRVIPICCVADSVARYQVLNFQSFAAYYGCTFCYKTSVRTKGGQSFTVSEPAEKRTETSLRADYVEVYNRRNEVDDKKRVYRGVKGFTPLVTLKYFTVTSGCPVDFMHAVLMGVAKAHTELILDPTFKKCWIGLKEARIGMAHVKTCIDTRITAIQSNTLVPRDLRPITVLASWKASEWLSWLLYYYLPCLKDLLKEKYLFHFSLLSEAVHILLQKTVTHSRLGEAHGLLMMYTVLYESYFTDVNMRYNIHLLSHIAQGVLDFGPICGHNSFVFETYNRNLRSLSKNPHHAVLEIANRLLIYKSIPILFTKMVSSEKVASFSEKKLSCLERFVHINVGCKLLGKGSDVLLSKNQVDDLVNHYNVNQTTKCVSYDRMVFRRARFTTANYSKDKKKNDSCFLTSTGKYFIIIQILAMAENCVLLYAQEVKVENRPCLEYGNIKIKSIKKVQSFGGMNLVNPESILRSCMYMKASDGFYISEIPYGSKC